jgi:hypothetical protein
MSLAPKMATASKKEQINVAPITLKRQQKAELHG